MWRTCGLLALAFSLGIAAPVCLASETEPGTVRWMVQDVPPHFSFPVGKSGLTAKDLGNGELDGMLKLLIARMPQYRHEFVDAGLARFETLVRQGDALCSVLHVRTPERLSWLYFTHTHPTLFSRQIHVIVHRDSLARFETLNQPLQFADLLQRSDLMGLLPRDRSYGPKIDGLLKEHAANAPKTVNAGRTMQLLAMLRAKRMDYTLDYPSTADEFMRNNQALGELVKIPLVDTRTTGVATVACSRSPEGRKHIEAIDAAVRKLAQEPNREAWVRAWRGDSVDEQDRQRINRYMDERARGGPQID